jgi:preprotein translocase subunit SecG
VQGIVWAVTIASALSIIGLVLIQHGKGADVGAAFGSGSAGSLFGSSGAANFLSRTTAALAAVFFVGCLLLTYLSVSGGRGKGVLDRVAPAAPVTAPASVPAPATSPPATDKPAGNPPAEQPTPAGTQSQDIPK